MNGKMREWFRNWRWALAASLFLHVLIAAFLFFGLPRPDQQPDQQEQPVNVAIVPPPDQPKPKPAPKPPESTPEKKAEKPPEQAEQETYKQNGLAHARFAEHDQTSTRHPFSEHLDDLRVRTGQGVGSARPARWHVGPVSGNGAARQLYEEGPWLHQFIRRGCPGNRQRVRVVQPP